MTAAHVLSSGAEPAGLFAVVISNVADLKFMRAGLREYAQAFDRIAVAIGRQAWDGTPEDAGAIQDFERHCSEEHPNVRVVPYDVRPEAPASRPDVRPEMFWEGHARTLALAALRDLCGAQFLAAGRVLFLDSDEILDRARFEALCADPSYAVVDALKLANYWYWREPTLRAVDYLEDSAVLIRGSAINNDTLFSNLGRHGVFADALARGCLTLRNVKAPDGAAAVHHYSWVRSRAEMLQKVAAWGHRNDRRDWAELVAEEFSRPFNGTDFVKGLPYQVVPDQFGLGASSS